MIWSLIGSGSLPRGHPGRASSIRRMYTARLDEICRSDLDALVIITQPWLHAAQCIQAMESGKHVFSAVPVVCLPDGDEILDWCDRLVSVCRRTGMHYMLGETTYYRPQTMFCRRRAREGAFGDFIYAEGEYFHDVDSACNLRDVMSSRLAGRAGRQWEKRSKVYEERGVRTGPMPLPHPLHQWTHQCDEHPRGQGVCLGIRQSDRRCLL